MALHKRKLSFGRKMGLMQLGLVGVGMILLVCALVVKEQRAAVAEVQSMAAEAPAAGGGVDGSPGAVVSGTTSSPGYPGTGLPIRSEEIPPAVGDVVNPQEPPQEACDFNGWVGQKVDEAALKATGRPYRILAPGMAMTEDYSPARINADTTDNGIVTRVWCG